MIYRNRQVNVSKMTFTLSWFRSATRFAFSKFKRQTKEGISQLNGMANRAINDGCCTNFLLRCQTKSDSCYLPFENAWLRNFIHISLTERVMQEQIKIRQVKNHAPNSLRNSKFSPLLHFSLLSNTKINPKESEPKNTKQTKNAFTINLEIEERWSKNFDQKKQQNPKKASHFILLFNTLNQKKKSQDFHSFSLSFSQPSTSNQKQIVVNFKTCTHFPSLSQLPNPKCINKIGPTWKLVSLALLLTWKLWPKTLKFKPFKMQRRKNRPNGFCTVKDLDKREP